MPIGSGLGSFILINLPPLVSFGSFRGCWSAWWRHRKGSNPGRRSGGRCCFRRSWSIQSGRTWCRPRTAGIAGVSGSSPCPCDICSSRFDSRSSGPCSRCRSSLEKQIMVDWRLKEGELQILGAKIEFRVLDKFPSWSIRPDPSRI